RLIRRVIVTRHAIVFPVTHFRRVALPLTSELYVGNLVQEKIWHTWIGKVGILQHDSETDALVIAAGQIERDLPPFRKVEAAGMFLDIAPVGANVDLLRKGQLDQIFERSFQRL